MTLSSWAGVHKYSHDNMYNETDADAMDMDMVQW